jgi:hypothetical protein
MFVLHGKMLLAGVLLAGLGSPGAAMQAGPRAGEDREPSRISMSTLRHFSADLTIRHRRVTPSGVPIGLPRPDAVMRIVRERRGGRWVTTLTADRVPESLVDVPGGPPRLSNPFLVARVEFADDEEQPRLFDRRGQLVGAMTVEDLRLVGAVATARGGGRTLPAASGAGGVFVAEAGGQEARRHDLERRFGAPVDRVRGLDRYVTTTSDARHEVLVTADTALPVEILTSSTSAGQMRTGVTYEAYGDYGHVRRLMRSEHHFAEGAAGRSIIEVELANVVLSTEVQP